MHGTESAQLHPARSIPRVHSEKYQQSARISACTENAGAEGFSNGPNPVDPTPPGDQPQASWLEKLKMTSTSPRREQQPLLAWGDVVEDYLPNGKVGDCLSTSAHSLTAIIGIGILALPYAVSYLGWIAGPILIFVFYLCTVLSNYLLVSIYQLHGRTHSTYHMAVRDIMESRRYAIVVSSLQLFNMFLVLIAFAITGGNAIQQVRWVLTLARRCAPARPDSLTRATRFARSPARERACTKGRRKRRFTTTARALGRELAASGRRS